MDQPWQQDNCDELKAIAKSFSIIEASLRWCGLPEEMLDEIISEAKPKSSSGVGRGIWTHYAVPCLEARSTLIARAIEVGELPQAREDGLPVTDHVTPSRRHVVGKVLRNWMIENHPAERPEFLFSESEEDVSASTSKQVREASGELSTRSENSYLTIIAALLEVIKGNVPHFDTPNGNQAELIVRLVEHYSGFNGMSKRNLEEKFARANKSFKS